MFRIGCLAVAASLLAAAPLAAQDWAEKMFQETSHDFGAVARAAKVEYQFVIKNPYKEDIHISGVRSSCGCTSPRIEKDTLKTHEQGAIVAAFNTRAFSGQRGARVTVTIDKPFFAEVQLQVRGYIRTDVVVDPGQVALGSVGKGQAVEKKVHVEYAGRSDWRVSDVKVSNPFISAKLQETNRANGRVGYDLTVTLNESAPAGYINDQLLLVTNDQRATQFPVAVEGFVVSNLTVSPSSLMLGILQPGQKVTKQLIVKGKQPFRVLSIESSDPALSFEVSDQAKELHMIPITFVAGDKPGKITAKIRIKTDLEDNSAAEITAHGQVSAPLAGKM